MSLARLTSLSTQTLSLLLERQRLQSFSPAEDGVPQPAPLHPIDQAVRDIAKDFRFTVEEVQEYYDKCGDAERTRNRFKKMRDVLNALKDEDDGPSGSTAATVAPST